MSLEFCVLGSGSTGNCAILRTPQGIVLIDAGFGPRVTAQKLHAVGLRIEQISAIVLTHLDSDHFNRNWFLTLTKHNVRLHCHASRRCELLALADDAPGADGIITTFSDDEFSPLDGLRARPIPLAHDNTGSHGFIFESADRRLAYATDLGRVPNELIDQFAGCEFIALESNYDRQMEELSPRPWFLKNRIMSGRGHLSNTEAFAAVRTIFDRTESLHGRHRLPRHVVLLHRSRECNCPNLLRRLFAADRRVERVLTLAHPFESTGWLDLRAMTPWGGEQLALALG